MSGEQERGSFETHSRLRYKLQERRERYVPPVTNKYEYRYFFADESPEDLLLAQQIQAQSYVGMGFVRPEGLIEVDEWHGRVFADGKKPKILAPEIGTPVEPLPQSVSYCTEYVVGIEKGSQGHDPVESKMLTWKKMYAPLDAMPAYRLCRDDLWDGWEEYLRSVDEHPAVDLVEIEAMGKTEPAGAKAIAELMKNELLRVQGNGELWYFNIVDSTFAAFSRMWGPLAIRQIGNARPLEHEHISKKIRVVPGVINADQFYRNMMFAIQSADNPFAHKSLEMFLYMTEGASEDVLDSDVAEFRRDCQEILRLRSLE